MNRTLPCVLFCLSSVALHYASEESLTRGHFLTPNEFIEIGEKSDVLYDTTNISSPEELPPELLPPALLDEPPQQTPMPVVGGYGGPHGALSSYTLSDAAQKAVEAANGHVKAKEYEKAIAVYKSALGSEPDCYILHLNLGDCLLFSGQSSDALKEYNLAAKLNPHDYHVYWFQASALYAMKRYADSYEAYVKALTLSPRHPRIINSVSNRATELGITSISDPFVPQAAARQEGDTIMIYSTEPPHWWIYGLCKAVWLAEESHRIDLTGKSDHNWTNTEERECLANLIVHYHTSRDEGEVEPDPQLDRLIAILDHGNLDGFVFYEIGGPALPDMILLLPEVSREEIASYIRRFVLPRHVHIEDTSNE